MRCIVCGCTDRNACIYEEEIDDPDFGNRTRHVPCYWVAPNLCSNPSCLEQVTASLVSGDEVLRAG